MNNQVTISRAKTVFFTGASSGIGYATANAFAKAGYNVVATMRNTDKGSELKRKGMAVVSCDVTDPASIQRAADVAISVYGKIDVVVNNAGYGLMGAFEAQTEQQIKKQFDTNFFGVQAVTRVFLPHFKSHRDGLFINVSSIAGRSVLPLYSTYHATKFAVEGFTESLQHELRPLGIRVKLVEPGPVRTQFTGASADIADNGRLGDYSYQDQLLGKLSNMGDKMGQDAEQVAAVILKAAGDSSYRLRYVSGSVACMTALMRRMLPDAAQSFFVRKFMI